MAPFPVFQGCTYKDPFITLVTSSGTPVINAEAKHI